MGEQHEHLVHHGDVIRIRARLTEQLLARGDRVAATVRRADALDDLKETAGERLWVAELDVTDADGVQRVVDAAFEHFGTIDVIVNNAGYALFGAIEEPTRDQVRAVVDANLMGSIDVIRAALPHLREQDSSRILQISSAGGQTAYPGYGLYHAAKWGIEGFCEALAGEVSQFGIRVTIVEPGMTPTGFSASKELAEVMPEYDQGEFGRARQYITSGRLQGPNDPKKIVRAIIDLADGTTAPLRLPLGVDTYRDLRSAYEDRLRHLEEAKAVAESVGSSPAAPPGA